MSLAQKRLTYIEENKNLSANQILINWKGSELSLRRQDGLSLIRITRGIKPKTRAQRIKNIPTKYLKTSKRLTTTKQPIIELPTPPEGTYKIATLKNKKTNEKYFIKFQNQQSLQRQINLISQKYGFLFSDSSLEISSKEYTYTPFIDYEYAKEFA